MIFGFSILVSVYTTAIVAGLAYQQIEPIVKIVPSIARLVARLGKELEQRWKRFTLPEIRKRMEKAENFLDYNQELAEWVLRKYAVRLAIGWLVLALGIIFAFLLIAALLQTKADARVIEISKEVSVSAWTSVILPGLGVFGALAILWKNRMTLRIVSNKTEDAEERVSEGFLARQLMKLEESGRGIFS